MAEKRIEVWEKTRIVFDGDECLPWKCPNYDCPEFNGHATCELFGSLATLKGKRHPDCIEFEKGNYKKGDVKRCEI